MASTVEKLFEQVSSAHGRGRLAHSFLISGAEGSGKSDLAARMAHMVTSGGFSAEGGGDLFGESAPVSVPPLEEMESGSVRLIQPRKKSRIISVEEIRDLEKTLHLAVAGGGYKVGVVMEADRMNDQAANAFLKTLEEPPRNTLLLLLSANPQRLLPTILSRCVRLSLLGARPLLEHGGAELVGALTKAAQSGFGNPVAALTMKAIFAQHLAKAKESAEKMAKDAQKEEAAAYRDGTDGAWLKGREDFHKAASSAEYLGARNRLFDVIMAWMADIVRIKVGGGGLDFPESAGKLRSIAEAESETRLVQRMNALDELRRTLETNAFEPLTLDVGFLKAFG